MPRRLDLLLYIITESKYSRNRSLEELIEPCLKGGASVIQLRDKSATTRSLVEKALRLRGLTLKYSALFIVNDRVDVALVSSADGVHLGADDMSPDLAREVLGPGRIIGKTVRTRSEALVAASEGVDYVAAGSVNRSKTKSTQVIGLEGLKEVCSATSLPVVAIGGLTLEDLPAVFESGASGVAVARGVLDSEEIEVKARDYRSVSERLVLPGKKSS